MMDYVLDAGVWTLVALIVIGIFRERAKADKPAVPAPFFDSFTYVANFVQSKRVCVATEADSTFELRQISVTDGSHELVALTIMDSGSGRIIMSAPLQLQANVAYVFDPPRTFAAHSLIEIECQKSITLQVRLTGAKVFSL